MDRDLITVKELMERISISERTITQWIRQGRIPCYQPGKGKRFVRWSEVEAYIESTRIEAASNENVIRGLERLFGKK